MRSIFVLLLLLLSSSPIAGSTSEVDTVFWKRVPLKMVLPIAKEKLIILPFEANVHMPQALMRDLEMTLLGDRVVLKPKKLFKPTRIKIRSRDNNNPYLFLIDIVSMPHGSERSVEIKLPELSDQGQNNHPTQSADHRSPPFYQHKDIENPIATLARFVSQRLYAPTRLWEVIPSVQPTTFIEYELPLYSGGAFSTRAIGSWRMGNYYATALLVTNISSVGRELDVRLIRGNYKARAGHAFFLHRKGDPHSQTAVVLITKQPFEQAIAHYLTPKESTE
jgi:integrating conjugative element protein (TIGR03749 family)